MPKTESTEPETRRHQVEELIDSGVEIVRAEAPDVHLHAGRDRTATPCCMTHSMNLRPDRVEHGIESVSKYDVFGTNPRTVSCKFLLDVVSAV